VTGGTGFVGAHSVRALVHAGHEVRLLARAPERVRPALDPLGVGGVDVVVGDATDADRVGAALEGCDAVLHAASVYALAQRRAAEIEAVNARCTELVLGLAAERGLDPIVHVSSYVALLPPPPDRRLTADAPVGRPAGPYARSKAASEAIARRLQDRGAPVVSVQPGAVWGPHDPALGENSRLALTILRGRMPVALPGPLSIVDVRDLAAVHAATMRAGRGPRRFLAVAEDVPFAELLRIFRQVTGRRLPAVPLPRAALDHTLGRLRRVPGDLEGVWYAAQQARCDARATQDVLGIRFRPAAESVADTIRWLYAAGHVDAARAGRLAAERAGVPA
jgi:nucleoside-diphosphate-sugar epimerase